MPFILSLRSSDLHQMFVFLWFSVCRQLSNNLKHCFFIFSVTNLKYWGRCEPVISRTLQFLNDLSVGYPFHCICDILTQQVHLHGQIFFPASNFPKFYNKKSNLFSLIYKCVFIITVL